MRQLHQCVQKLLTQHGALVESRQDGEVLEVLLPQKLCPLLNLPELCHFSLVEENTAEGVVPLTLESEVFSKLENLSRGRGKSLVLQFIGDISIKNRDQLEKPLARELLLGNAAFRLREITQEEGRYRLQIYRAVLSSDEKREEVVTIAFNESNFCLHPKLTEAAFESLRHHSGIREIGDGSFSRSFEKANVLSKMLEQATRTIFDPFMKAVLGRLDRDLARLREYHQSLQTDILQRMAEKRRRGIDEETLSSEHHKLSAVAREYEAKVADLIRKFSLVIEVEPLQTLILCIPVQRLHLSLLRRKTVRPFHLDWNPLTKSLDTVCCEQCMNGEKPLFLSDETLQFFCGNCRG